MANSKRQVVFIARKLWSGGAEKVLYNLAHKLDKRYFESFVTYMIKQEDIPVSYDPSIPLICLDTTVNADSPAIPSMPGNRKEGIIKRGFHRLPHQQRFKIKTIINHLLNRVQGYLNPPPFVPDNFQQVLQKLNVITQAVSIPLTYSYGLQQVVSTLRDDAVFVALQEEPTVQVWLNQIYKKSAYFSYLCAPESMHLPLIYTDPDRLQVEKWLFANACRGAENITVPNRWMFEDMVANFGVDGNRIKVVENPIDCAAVQQKALENPSQPYPDPGNKTIFVQLARMDPQKNYPLLVEACTILRQKYEDFVVWVIGDGADRLKIEELINKHQLQQHIILLGELGNPYPFLSKARASLLTSSFEASPLAQVDSLLLGAVPISVDCIAGPRDTLGDGRYGLLVPLNNPEAFAEAMFCIAKDDDLHSRLSSLGRKRAMEFDLHLFVSKWEEMLIENVNR